MPRIKAQDTPAQRKIKIMDTISRRLDDLDDDDARARVLTWLDSTVDQDDSGKELAAMKAIAGVFEGVDADTREVVVRFLIENYGSGTRQEDEPAE